MPSRSLEKSRRLRDNVNNEIIDMSILLLYMNGMSYVYVYIYTLIRPTRRMCMYILCVCVYALPYVYRRVINIIYISIHIYTPKKRVYMYRYISETRRKRKSWVCIDAHETIIENNKIASHRLVHGHTFKAKKYEKKTKNQVAGVICGVYVASERLKTRRWRKWCNSF